MLTLLVIAALTAGCADKGVGVPSAPAISSAQELAPDAPDPALVHTDLLPSEIPKNLEEATSHSLEGSASRETSLSDSNWPRELTAEMDFPNSQPSSDIPEGFMLASALANPNSTRAFHVLREMALFEIRKGKGERQLVVFSDPSSAYDRAFFDAVSRADNDLNATISVLPLATGYESALAKEMTVALACLPNPSQAWQDWARFAVTRGSATAPAALEDTWEEFYTQNKPVVSGCAVASDLMEVFGAANQVGVDYTPALVFANGQPWPGPIISREEIEKMWWYVKSKESP